MPDRILLFIPCFNCERQIDGVLGQVAALAPGLVHEIFVVDNRSHDGTVAAAVASLVRISSCTGTVVRNNENYGLGGSHKIAFAYAERENFTHVVVLHGDGQGNFADLVPLLERGTHREHDACLGGRFMPRSRLLGYSRFRAVGNRVFNALFSLATRQRIFDLGSGLNVFARLVFCDRRVEAYPDDLRFNVYLLLGLVDQAFRFCFFAISWRADRENSSVNLISQAIRTLSIAAEFLLRREFFRVGDHRHNPRQSYSCDIIARHLPVNALAHSHPTVS